MTVGSLEWYAMVAATIDALYVEELGRHSEIVGAATWLYHAREEGKDVEWMRAQIRQSSEWHARHDAPPVPVRPAPITRAPLVFPVCGSCPEPDSYDQMLPWTPPQARDYLRANSWGIPIPGLPFLPGIGSREHPERFLSYLFPLYPTPCQEQWFVENHRRGYTHVVFSWPNARVQAGQNIAQFKADCQRAKAAGFSVHAKVGSKDMDPRDQTLEQWQLALEPLMDLCAGTVDEYSFWEYDAFNVDGQTAIDIHKYFGAKAHAQGASFWCHFLPEHAFWCPQGDEFWWRALGADVDGLDYQAKSEWDIGELQARSVDILNLFARTGHKLRQFEPGTPSLMFAGDHPTEDEADAIGYLACCTKANSQVWGYGNGARKPDGQPL